MKHIEFMPLKGEGEVVELRCSELNSYINPSPYGFPNIDSRAECMSLGKRIHDICQYTYLFGLDRGIEVAKDHVREVNAQMPFYRAKEAEWFCGAAEQYAQLASAYSVYKIEQGRDVLIDYSGYIVYFTGTSDADGLLVDGVYNRNIMIDIKSSGGKRTEDKAKEERQKYYYSWLKNIVNGTKDDIEFRYHIYTKQKKPQFQEFVFNITYEEAERVTKQDMKMKLTAIKLESLSQPH